MSRHPFTRNAYHTLVAVESAKRHPDTTSVHIIRENSRRATIRVTENGREYTHTLSKRCQSELSALNQVRSL